MLLQGEIRGTCEAPPSLRGLLVIIEEVNYTPLLPVWHDLGEKIHIIKPKNVIILLIVSKQQCSSLQSHPEPPDEYEIMQVNSGCAGVKAPLCHLFLNIACWPR